MVLDAQGRILQSNAAADAALRVSGTLALRDGALSARRRQDRWVLRRLCALAAAGVIGLWPIPRAGHATTMRLSPLAHGRVLVRLFRGMHRDGPPEAYMRQRFAMSGMEAELAVRFAEGASLAEASRAMQLGLAEALALQQSVFRKTGMAGADALRLMLAQITG